MPKPLLKSCPKNPCHQCHLLRGGPCRIRSAGELRISTSLRLVAEPRLPCAFSQCPLAAEQSKKQPQGGNRGDGAAHAVTGRRGQLSRGGRTAHRSAPYTEPPRSGARGPPDSSTHSAAPKGPVGSSPSLSIVRPLGPTAVLGGLSGTGSHLGDGS